MLIVLLCILFSSTLVFNDLTVAKLWEWFNLHPFLFMCVVAEFVEYSRVIK